MTKDEALKMALEALENHTAIKHPQQRGYRDEAIAAIKDALTEPEQEPVAWVLDREACMVWWSDKFTDIKQAPPRNTPLYTAPPQRPWIGLTRDESFDIINRLVGQDWIYAIDAVEQALKDKNHG